MFKDRKTFVVVGLAANDHWRPGARAKKKSLVDCSQFNLPEEESVGSSFGISLVGCSLGTRMMAANDFSKVPSMLITLCP